MSITIKTTIPEKSDRKAFKNLYLSAFPKEERAPFFLILSRLKTGKAEILTAHENGKFIGFAYMVCWKDLAYLFYLAVDGTIRGKGYGTQILNAVKNHYHNRRIFLAREQLDQSAENYDQRISRHAFYVKNGFTDLPCQIKEASVIYDVMGIGGNITAQEYKNLMMAWAGKFLSKMIDMKLIEKF
ncbi:MAG: GNAT family N-acetyltransferase [Oscillospiraceae bacterium]|nr:GNAT family N-acetyltransferase [Oscillospiraceae bacterium]